MSTKLWIYVLFSVILFNVSRIETFDDFCDEPHPTLYCTCDVNYRQTLMACYVIDNVKKDNKIWNEMSKVENVYSLKLFVRKPVSFEEIPIDSLQSMPYLEILKVQQANISELEPYAISGLKYLRELDLEDCGITALQDHSISDMPKLKKLSLSDNYLQELLAETFTGLLDLESLFLERNSISRIEGCAFCDLQNLRELDLFQNEITDLTDYMFRGLRYLKRLDISKNKISILNDKIFHSMPKLEELDLHNNLIHHIAPRAFHGLEKLQRISLRMNKIKMLPDKVFKSLPKLRTVEVYDNELETFQVQIVEHMDNNKEQHFSVDFSRNPLVCDCRLSWVKKYIKLNSSRQFSGILHNIQCMDEEKNVTHTVRLLHLDCAKFVESRKRMPPTPAIIVDLVPHEIQKQHKNKTFLNEDITEADTIVSQDSEMEPDEISEVKDSGPSSSTTISADFNVVVFVTLLTVFLVRKRKGTCGILV